MFGKLFQKAFEARLKMRIERDFYGAVVEELENGFRSKEIWGEAIAKSKGNKDKAESIYVERRAMGMQAYYDLQLDSPSGIEDIPEFIEWYKHKLGYAKNT